MLCLIKRKRNVALCGYYCLFYCVAEFVDEIEKVHVYVLHKLTNLVPQIRYLLRYAMMIYIFFKKILYRQAFDRDLT